MEYRSKSRPFGVPICLYMRHFFFQAYRNETLFQAPICRNLIQYRPLYRKPLFEAPTEAPIQPYSRGPYIEASIQPYMIGLKQAPIYRPLIGPALIEVGLIIETLQGCRFLDRKLDSQYDNWVLSGTNLAEKKDLNMESHIGTVVVVYHRENRPLSQIGTWIVIERPFSRRQQVGQS